jgi:Transmembrane protein 43
MDQYTERTTTGFGSRLLQSIKGVLIGLLLFLAAFPVLWLNEGYAVRTARSLTEGAKTVISVAPDRVEQGNEGKLVHMTGRATTTDEARDPAFGVSVNAIKLHRKVEMYQWKETSTTRKEKQVGGSEVTTTTYSYAPVWSERTIDSTRFKKPEEHLNPAMPFSSAEYVASNVTLGAFRLNSSMVEQLTAADPVDVSGAELPDSIQDKARPVESGFEVGDPASPQVGDLRIAFTQLKDSDVSIVARQLGNTFEPYSTKAGGTIQLIATGVQSAENMFATAQTANSVRTWILRGVGMIVMLIGSALILGPLSTVADIVPFVGSLVQLGTGLISFAISLCLSLFTIAVAWIAYRPLLGVGLLAIAAIVVYATMRMRGKKEQLKVHATLAG